MSVPPTPVIPSGDNPALTESASQIQDLINMSIQAALASATASSRVQLPMAPPVMPPQCGEPPVKKVKTSHKRKNTLAVHDSPAGEVNNLPLPQATNPSI